MSGYSLLGSSNLIRIFISSPGDVTEERAILRKLIGDLQYDPFLRGQVTIEEISWDRPGAEVPLLASLTPQEALERGIPMPGECDIVVVVMWSRMGTPLAKPYVKPDGTEYLSGTEWEYLNAVTAARSSGRPEVLLYRRTAEVRESLRDPGWGEKLTQLNRVDQFFAKTRNSDGSIETGYNSYPDPASFQDLVEGHLRLVIKRLLDERGSSNRDSTPRPLPMPAFPGLRSFREGDSIVYFGRERETSELINRLADPRCQMLAVIGASGTGKSSLVHAGLIPRLRAGAIPGSSDWKIITMLPGEIDRNPFVALASHLVSDPALTDHDVATLAADLESDPATFPHCAERMLVKQKPWAHLVLVIDQFEELLSPATLDDRYQAAFVGVISKAIATSRIRLVITLRADFYARCLEFSELARLLRAGSFPLGSPSLGSLCRMITRPAEMVGLRFEDGLAERILDDTGSEPGGLALMAFALHRLCQRATDRGLMLSDEYQRMGGIQGAIATHAEEVFNQLESTDRDYLPKVFRKLADVTESGTTIRCRTSLHSFGADDVAQRLIRVLVDARLVVISNQNLSRPTVEVAHESLFNAWPRLTAWIQQRQDDLALLRQVRRAAIDWECSGRASTFLWPHERLVLVHAMIANLDPELDEVVRDFVIPESTRLLAELDGACSHERRAAIGDRLDRIGDTRPGVNVDTAGIPDIRWSLVPAGQVSRRDHEGTMGVPKFWISAYPVTYGQYLAFLEAEDGFANDLWFVGLAMRPSRPGEQLRRSRNQPAENVSWYDAVAFSRWLSARSGLAVRLPTEWEWQLAALGSVDGRSCVLGVDWDAEIANSQETGLSRAVAVGLYPRGATAAGVHDLFGNVWEWCLNEFSSTDQAVHLESDAARSVRGGSWLVLNSFARADFRGWDDPGLRYSALGFRLVREFETVNE